jgi:lipooligosaccharide transport system permease protein
VTKAPRVSDHGIDHAALAARTRRWGWWHFARYRQTAEIPFLATTLATAAGNPVLYLSAMGIGLGALVQQDVAGVSYLHFVAPALLVSTVATTGAGWGTWPMMSGFKWQRYYISAAATPIAPAQIPVGETVALAMRLLLQAAVFWVLGLPFGAWLGPWSWLTVPVAALAGLAMFAPLMSYSATLTEEGLEFNFINRLIVMPMFLFAGTFFPLESMPVYLRWIGWVSPMWHGTQLSRVASFGMPYPAWGVLGHLAVLVAFIAVGLVASRRVFRRRLVS